MNRFQPASNVSMPFGGGENMTPAWAQRQEALLRDCIVFPDVFHPMVDRLGDFVMPYQHALATEAGKRNVHLYLEGLLSHLPRKNAEEIAALVDVKRLVMQDFIGTAPWDHRPLVKVLVGEVVDRLGEPDGIIAFDPSSFPKRGTHSVGVKRQWCGHRGKVDNCQVGVFMGYVSRDDHTLLDFRLSLPADWVRDEQRRQACHVPPVGMDEYQVRTWQGWHHHMVLSLLAVWFLIGETHRGQQWTPALTLPQVRYGLSLLLLEVFCTPGIDYICRQVHRHNWLQVFQRVNAGHLPHSRGQERETLAVPSAQCMARSGSE
jgi:SRSO17 transposase